MASELLRAGLSVSIPGWSAPAGEQLPVRHIQRRIRQRRTGTDYAISLAKNASERRFLDSGRNDESAGVY